MKKHMGNIMKRRMGNKKIPEQGKESVFEKIFKILTFSTVIFGILTFFMNYQISLQYESFYEVPYEYFLIHNVYLNKLFTFLCMIFIFVSLALFFYLDIDEYEKEKKHVKLSLIILIIFLFVISLMISYSFTGIFEYSIAFIILVPVVILLSNKSNKNKAIIYTSASVLLIINILNYLNPSFSDPSTKNEYEILELKDANNKKEDDNHIETYIVKISEKDGNFVVIDGKICNDNKTLKLKKGSYKLVDPTDITITYKNFKEVVPLNQEEFDKIK